MVCDVGTNTPEPTEKCNGESEERTLMFGRNRNEAIDQELRRLSGAVDALNQQMIKLADQRGDIDTMKWNLQSHESRLSSVEGDNRALVPNVSTLLKRPYLGQLRGVEGWYIVTGSDEFPVSNPINECRVSVGEE